MYVSIDENVVVQLRLKFEEAEVGGVTVFASSGSMLQRYWLKVVSYILRVV